MSFNIRIPNITASSPTEQVRQVHSYLYQVVEQLNWALNTIESAQSGNTSSNASSNVKFEQSEDISPKEAENTFNSIKALIIKSADIVKAYEETIKSDFNGEYFADSDFGTYLEQTKSSIETSSKGVEELYTNVRTITNKDGNGTLDELSKDVRTTNSYIKRGYLGDDKNTGDAVYGIAVGETDDNGIYRRYAWFTADKLTFFDENDSEVAYIGNGCLYILGTSRFIGDVFFGGYKADTSDGIAFTWIG
jgi:hypothetical protein